MEVLLLSDPVRFAELTGDFLAAEPFTANVIAVQLTSVLAGNRARDRGDLWIAVLRGRPTIGDDAVLGVAMQTTGFSLNLPRLSAGVPAAIARAVARAGHALPGVNGEKVAVAEFCQTWEQLTGQSFVTKRAMRMYRLGELAATTGVAGAARPAASGDLDLVASWLDAFNRELVGSWPEPARRVAERRIAAGALFLWEDAGTPVALAGRSAVASGVARVGPVYTPPSHRRRGYGSAVTTTATRAALEAGAREVVLYTDLANPTSNAIYQAIGYRPDHDAEERGPAPA